MSYQNPKPRTFKQLGAMLNDKGDSPMFIVFEGRTQFVSSFTGNMLLMIPGYREATAKEAAQLVNVLVAGGDGLMHFANDRFKELYHKPIIKNPSTIAFSSGNGAFQTREFDQ